MQIVIDIPKEQYSLIMQLNRMGTARYVDKEVIMNAIKNGIPIPITKHERPFDEQDILRGEGMSKTIQKPLACRNAHCGAMCSSADIEFFHGNPSKCWNYERRDDLYRETELLDKIKQTREEIDTDIRIAVKHFTNTDAVIDYVLDSIDELIEEEEE